MTPQSTYNSRRLKRISQQQRNALDRIGETMTTPFRKGGNHDNSTNHDADRSPRRARTTAWFLLNKTRVELEFDCGLEIEKARALVEAALR